MNLLDDSVESIRIALVKTIDLYLCVKRSTLSVNTLHNKYDVFGNIEINRGIYLFLHCKNKAGASVNRFNETNRLAENESDFSTLFYTTAT